MQEDTVKRLRKEIDKIKPDSHRAKPFGEAAIELKGQGEARTFFIFADERKNYSGIKLVKDKRYSFRIEEYSHRWFDEGVDAHPICGWRDQANTSMRKIVRFFGGLFSYSWSDDLMVLLGVVEGLGDDENLQFSFTMDKKSIKESSNEREIVGEFHSPGTGELYVFANDAKSDLFKDFYKNNVGYLKVTLELTP